MCAGSEEEEETYASFARKSSASNSCVKQYGRVKNRVKHDIILGRFGTNVELSELDEYRKMVSHHNSQAKATCALLITTAKVLLTLANNDIVHAAQR